MRTINFGTIEQGLVDFYGGDSDYFISSPDGATQKSFMPLGSYYHYCVYPDRESVTIIMDQDDNLKWTESTAVVHRSFVVDREYN